MGWQELQQYRQRLRTLEEELLKRRYKDAFIACELKPREPPEARHIQELVQVWKELVRRRPQPKYRKGMR